jgi:hypothetical protein
MEVKRSVQKIIGYIFLLTVFTLSMGVAQKESLRFDAGSLYTTAAKITGDSLCWPLIVALAERDAASNSFILNAEAQNQVRDFSTLHKKVKTAKLNLSQEIKSGAKVFATEELDTATTFIKAYEAEIAKGNISEIRRFGQNFVSSVGTIEKLITKRRTEAIDAKLAQKTNIVDKRKGLLGSWQSAFVGDLFAAYDGVKTGEASLAQLFFADGVDVTIDPNTTVVIRESHKDRLDQTVKRDLALVNGSILTKLSAKAKETNKFAFRAGSSESMIKSGKFWASTVLDKKAKLSNYDGTIDLRASNVKITLEQNQGTIVEKGKPPLPPVNLLGAPQLTWERLDSVIYSEEFLLEWSKVNNASSYQVEVCPSKNFDRDMKRISSKSPSLRLTGVPLASLYLRIQAIDKYELRGIDSPVYRLIRVKDTQPPPIQIHGWDMDRKYTSLEELTIKGKTKAEAAMTVDGKVQPVQTDGSFSFRVPVTQPETQVKIIVTDQSGNKSTRTLSIVPMETEKLFRIQWDDRVDNDTIFLQGETIEGHGNAYPGVKVTAMLDGQYASVQTNSQGDWAISLKAVKGSSLQLTFDAIEDGKTIGTKVWKIE